MWHPGAFAGEARNYVVQVLGLVATMFVYIFQMSDPPGASSRTLIGSQFIPAEEEDNQLI